MFSRKIVLLTCLIFFIAMNFTLLAVSSQGVLPKNSIERLTMSLIAPFQRIVSRTASWTEKIWNVYFSTVYAVQENYALKNKLALAVEYENRCRELELENNRLRKFINFKEPDQEVLVAARVVGRDPSPWFKTIIIDKGEKHGVVKGLPVVVSEGVVGQVVNVSEQYSRVLLIIDRNSAVDALVQNSRARGMVKGNNTEECLFKYALRKDVILNGQVIITSGLDQVFPKGLRVGVVVDVKKEDSRLFQKIVLQTCVDFDKLEEVLVTNKAVSGDTF